LSWSIEEYLVHVLDYFEDYSGSVLIMAYDLRIDAYIDYRVGLITDYKIVEPGLLKITRKAKREITEGSETHIEFDLERVHDKSLNPIEAAHFQKFLSTHQHKILEARSRENKRLMLCLGAIQKISPYKSAIYENSFELSVLAPQLGNLMTLLTRDADYKLGDQVCFLVKKDKELVRILGMKPRSAVSEYLDQKSLERKNNEMNLIEMT